jgi:aminotransferase
MTVTPASPETAPYLSNRLRDILDARGDARASSPHTPQINLGQGTPDLPTPPHVLDAVKASLANPYIQYTAYDGIPELRAAIAAKLSRDNKLDYDPDTEIMATNGAQEAVFIALQATLDPGDELLIGDPHYTVYDEIAGLLGASVIPVPSIPAQGFAYDLGAMAAAITPKTKAIALVSPDNPTGAVQTSETVARIAALAVQHDLLVISDELYERFVFDGARHVSIATLPGMRDRTITIGGLSKTYAMTGWRAGYLGYPAAYRAAMILIKHSLSISTAVPVQVAALAALTGPPESLAERMALWEERRTYLYDTLADLKLPVIRTPGAFYALIDITSTGLSSAAFSNRFADEEGVRVTPGHVFGPAGDAYVRVSFMTPRPDLDTALEKLGRFWSHVGGQT